MTIKYNPSVPPIIFDTETVGFHGMCVLIQYSIGDGPIQLFEPWTQPVYETLKLIETIAMHPGGVIGFNLSFDWFHLCKLYTVFSLLPDWQVYPEDCIEEIAKLEPEGRFGPCLKPFAAHDVMLHARKGEYQSTMARGDIRIRRVPTPLAWELAAELEKRIPLSDIYFAKRKKKSDIHWKVFDIKDSENDVDPDFKDIVLSFKPSSALKALAIDALKLPPDATLLFSDIEVNERFIPEEHGWAPYAMAIGEPGNWRGAWPEMIRHHIYHWGNNKLARQYAEKDVEYTRRLYNHFGSPPLGDNDSELACMVGAVRWRGFAVDVEGLKELRKDAAIRKGKHPTDPGAARRYITQVLDPVEILAMASGKRRSAEAIKASTKKVILEEIAKWDDEPCQRCDGLGYIEDDRLFGYDDYDPDDIELKIQCDLCYGKKKKPHPAAIRAAEVLEARKAGSELVLLDKLILAGRLHADFVIVGTLSSRMAGAGGLNAQGIKRAKTVRSKFPLADRGLVLSGGDFASFEVVLAIAVYDDAGLRADVQRKRPCHKCTVGKTGQECEFCQGSGVVESRLCNHCFKLKEDRNPDCDDCKGTGVTGTKIHALFGMDVYPGMTYEDILNDLEKYTRAKSGLFAILYGGEDFTLKTRLGVDLEVAARAVKRFGERYPGVATARQKIKDMFGAISQPKGIGKQVFWKEPADYIESMFGFRRYFTLENRILRALYDLAQSPSPAWQKMKLKVTRRDREQSVSGAVQSALYGAAFALQGSNTRAAQNHVIQSSGAEITKKVQRDIWDIQPAGIGPWIVQPMNVHDELLSATDPAYVSIVANVVNNSVESFRSKVPLIEMEWKQHMNSWAEK